MDHPMDPVHGPPHGPPHGPTLIFNRKSPLLKLKFTGGQGMSSTIIYTSEFSVLCSTICVSSATRHNIHMYPYFLFAAIHHLKSSPTFSVRPCSSVGRVTVDLIWRSWVRFPPRSKYFLFASCGSLFPFTSANTQWVIHGFKYHYNLHFRVNSLFHYL